MSDIVDHLTANLTPPEHPDAERDPVDPEAGAVAPPRLTKREHAAATRHHETRRSNHQAALDELAKLVRAELNATPEAPLPLLTVAIEQRLGHRISEHFVHRVIDEYDGQSLEHRGPGRGGGWV